MHTHNTQHMVYIVVVAYCGNNSSTQACTTRPSSDTIYYGNNIMIYGGKVKSKTSVPNNKDAGCRDDWGRAVFNV